MKHNLMGKEKIENLGFDQVNSWDTEEKVSKNVKVINKFLIFWQRKRDLFRKLVEIDKMAERNLHRMKEPESNIDNNLYHVWCQLFTHTLTPH